MNKSDYLKFYSDKGWRVFPVKPKDKLPLFPAAHAKDDPLRLTCKGECGKLGHGLHDATSELNMLIGWLEVNPEMNLGLVAGRDSGFFVLDVDSGHGGNETLAELIVQHGELPKTPTAITGSGGKHILFKYPDFEVRNVQNSGKLGKGIDVRGTGGYIVAAPSIHPNGNHYVWDKTQAPSVTPLAPAPEWILKLLQAPAPVIAPQIEGDNSAIANGGRNNTLTSIAGTMRRKGMSTEAIYTALLVENKQKCIPPLADHEVKQIAESITRYIPDSVYEQNRDRLQTEWSFCKAIFEFPINAIDFQEILPEMFQDHTLQDFWRCVINNEDVTDSAVNAGILTELERYKDYDVSRVDGYARSIRRFAYLADVKKKGETLARQAASANDAGIEKAVNDINKIPSQIASRIFSIGDVADEIEERIRERARNPQKVWGIPYAWSYLSELTGGKQTGELTLYAAEPKLGKSWWNLQDALYTGIAETPVFYWCGEMKRTQLMTRFYQILGVNGRNMKSGSMTEADWDALVDAKALILNSPIYIDDKPLTLHEVRPMLVKQKIEHGIKQAYFDYAGLIQSPGINEIEQSQNTSRELKRVCQELDIAITLIASVNKSGMDSKTEGASKSNVRGSGQQIHDADNIYILTKFDGKHGLDYGLMPQDYESVVSLHLSAGRELDHQIENGFIPYRRVGLTPKFKELRKMK